MLALVADVERYPAFVPLCRSLTVTEREPLPDGSGETITARMTVAYKMFDETFVSRVTVKPDDGAILVEYLDGPFDHLENRWSFKPLAPDRCEVDFRLSYTFKSRALALVMGAVFDKAFARFSAAFEARADAIYGRARPKIDSSSPDN